MISLKAYLLTEKEPPKDGSYFMAFNDTPWGLNAFQCRFSPIDKSYVEVNIDMGMRRVLDSVDIASWCELPQTSSLCRLREED